jgi:hypothetical protein
VVFGRNVELLWNEQGFPRLLTGFPVRWTNYATLVFTDYYIKAYVTFILIKINPKRDVIFYTVINLR